MTQPSAGHQNFGGEMGMYYEYFGLDRAPYRITPDTDLFYPGGDRGAILDALVYAIVNGNAITKVVGEVGSGKTMLCRMLEVKLPKRIEIVYLANPSLSPEHIPHAIAFELGLEEAADGSRLQVMKALQDYLLEKHGENRQVVVFVEEAQSMPLETLEEIRLLSNLETRHHKLLQVVMFGQPELDERLSAPHVRQIKERITDSFELPPLAPKDIRKYLMFRLCLAGCKEPDIFHRGAVRLIARASGGLMRRINVLADKALLAAYTDNARVVKARHVRAAISDCEFAPRRSWGWPAAATASFAGGALLLSAWSHMGTAGLAGWSPGASSTADLEQALRTPPAAGIERSPHTGEAPGAAGPARSSSLLEDRLEMTRKWLSEADPDHFSIQVLVTDAGQEPALERLLQHRDIRDDLGKLYVHRVDIRGREMLGVLYGDYSDYGEAEAALKRLPEVLRHYNPYLRNVRYVLAESISKDG